MIKQFINGTGIWSRTIGVAILLFTATPSFAQSDAVLQPVGNAGGGPFYARCRAGDILTGVEIWTGDHVDAIKPICAPAVKGQFQEYHTRYGGNGGEGPRQVACPNDKPVVIGIDIKAEYSAVNNIHLYCGLAVATAQRFPFPMAAYDGPVSRNTENCSAFGKCSTPTRPIGALRCEPGLVAVGIVGRAGKFLDALGMICGAVPKPEQRFIPAPRVVGGAEQSAARVDICESARIAAARNSPATAGLQAQCAARGAEATRAEANDRQRAADFAVRGQVIGLKDPDITALRALYGSYGGGAFDAGLAAADGQTEWGPGKEALARSFVQPTRKAFMAAAEYMLDRNRNVARLPIGSEIAQADPELAEAREKNPDPRFWLGFDVATAIFGDPALGAQGNTALGPGSLGIRTALSPLGKQGFDAALKLHLSRTYRE